MNGELMTGFTSVQGLTHAPSLDLRFMDRAVDADEAHDLHESERCGCPLCISSHPQVHYGRLERRNDEEIGEGELPLPESDFRDRLDAEESEDIRR